MQKSPLSPVWILLWPAVLLAQADVQRAAEEFKIATRDMGLRADSVVKKKRNNILTSWHGRVYYNLRNDIFDAVPHEIAQRGGGKNLLRRGQYGFNVSGPVLARTTFASVSYEGVRERIGRNSLLTVANDWERTGDFSHTVDASGLPLPIYDPATTYANPAFDPAQPVSADNLEYVRLPFEGNRIPVHRLDPAAVRAVGLYPVANTNAGPFFKNNYFVVSPETNRASGMIFKVDHTVSDRNRLSTSLSFTNGFAGAPRLMPTVADSGSNDRSFSARRASVDYVFTRSPRTINTVSIEAASDRSDASREGEVFPAYRFSDYLGMGRTNPIQISVHNTYSINDGFSTRRGQHSLRFNARFTRYQVNAFLPQFPSGTFRFGSGLTSLPGVNNTGHSFASFLLGDAEYAEQSVIPMPSYWRRSIWNFSARDQIEVSKGLTVTLAFSTEAATPRHEKFGRISTIDLSAINPVNGRLGALVAGRTGQSLTVGPNASFSLAWNPRGNPKSVVRMGYSMSTQSVPLYTSQWGTQGFIGTPTYLSPNVQLTPAVVLSNGLPGLPRPLPDLRPEVANDTVADLVDPSGRLPLYQSASLTYERELPGQTMATVTLAHARGNRLFVSGSAANPNAIPLDNLAYRDDLNTEAFRRNLRPYPQYQRFDLYSSWPAGNYKRNSASVRLEKRSSSGMSVAATYEYSKQMDDYSGPYGMQDFYNRQNEWSLTAYNNPHRVSLSYAYELPFGANKPMFAYSDWRRYMVDGWSISGMSTLLSGEPIALRPQFNNTGGLVDALRVNLVPGVDPNVPDQGPALWFNPAAFDNPANFTLGDGPRTHPSLRNPGSQNHDLSVTKRIALTTERALELQATGFNVINGANWTNPDPVIGPASSPNVNAGKIIGSRGGRVIQIGMRLSF